jgi:hypothetical protein
MNMKEYITLLNEAKLLDAKLTSREARPTPDEKATPCLQEGGSHTPHRVNTTMELFH